MSPIVNIARCPEHGLHGERTECHVCGGPVEQVAMVPAGSLPDLLDAMRSVDLDLHVERAGARFCRAAAGERDEPLWVASVSRNDFALEADAPTPAEAVERLRARVASHRSTPRG